jgi:predicted GNAT family acetyltransferase
MAWDLDEAAREFERREPYMAVIENGAAVSLGHSSRLTDQAAEAGVETVDAYRGRGYASAVVAGWARTIRATGRIPLYSTSWNNLASQGVARKLRLVQYGTDLSLG